jgi:hypothetical protein
VPRTTPFAGLDDGPAPDAAIIEVGRPKPLALGCLGLTTLFLAVLAAAAFSYAAGAVVNTSLGAPSALRIVAVVLGIVFIVIVIGLVGVTVKAVRARQGLAIDAGAVWWRDGARLVEVPWADIAAARLVFPKKIRGARSSTPVTPTLELFPADLDVLRGYPDLVDTVISGERLREDLPILRFSFQLPTSESAELAEAALRRHAARQWAIGQNEAPE